MRDEAVEYEADEECAEYPFHPYPFHQPRSKEDKGQYKDELHHPVVIPAEKPPPDAWEKV